MPGHQSARHREPEHDRHRDGLARPRLELRVDPGGAHFGYPQAAPFNGNRLITTASTDWYTHDFTPGGQVSKIIGSDLTGGSSGGPWILGWAGAEFADTDGSSATDPGSNWVNVA